MSTRTRFRKTCIVCGEFKEYHAHGKCKRCYNKARKPTNTKSGTYLGCTIAEKVLSNVFNDVKIMKPNNPGYDFIYNKGKKIDVKSSCIGRNSRWLFNIKRNTTADFFLCIAFNDRKSLIPLHLWLLPSNEVKDKKMIGIRPNTIYKWDEFKLDISRTLQCCNQIKE